MKKADMIGKTFGRLTVVDAAPLLETDRKKRLRYKCECTCGETCVVVGESLRSGHTKSCGCLSRKGNPKHGDHNERLYRIWKAMKTRCLNPNAAGFDNYGGRGISVCPEWVNDYVSFRGWALDAGYRPDLTLDRKNNDLGYEPRNCRWVSKTTQSRNQRARKDSTTGVRGIRLSDSGLYLAEIFVDNKRVHLGSFKDVEAAISARKEAELLYWGGDVL